MAALQALEAGYQVALMAPTEIIDGQVHAHLRQPLQHHHARIGMALMSVCLQRAIRARSKTSSCLNSVWRRT